MSLFVYLFFKCIKEIEFNIFKLLKMLYTLNEQLFLFNISILLP